MHPVVACCSLSTNRLPFARPRAMLEVQLYACCRQPGPFAPQCTWTSAPMFLWQQDWASRRCRNPEHTLHHRVASKRSEARMCFGALRLEAFGFT
eukprot:15367955-Alexandrium_andersonii.AAC.1